MLHVPGADSNADAGDRNYLVLAKREVIMNDIRIRGLKARVTWLSRFEFEYNGPNAFHSLR